jgi:hypothetical protein
MDYNRQLVSDPFRRVDPPHVQQMHRLPPHTSKAEPHDSSTMPASESRSIRPGSSFDIEFVEEETGCRRTAFGAPSS